MNREAYKAAVGKIQGSDAFKNKLKSLGEEENVRSKPFRLKASVPAFAALLVIAFISVLAAPGLKGIIAGKGAADKFEITGENSSDMACYASILYMDGYVYSPLEWFGYSRYESDEIKYDELKGLKLGEVTLDLKGKIYRGMPPSFSSTYDVGTEIYSIKNIKKERAVLVVDKDNKLIFYRQGKAVADGKTLIDLTISDVSHMLSDDPQVLAVELRDENDGSWMRTSEKERLISLINKELPELSLLNWEQVRENKSDKGARIPVNLVFKDGAALHMQVYPETEYAYVFGAYVRLSSELCQEIKELFEQGDQYPSIADLLPYAENDVNYLYLVDNVSGDKVLCKNPQWSRSALYGILNYYRVEQVGGDSDKQLIFTATLGKSKADSMFISFYETGEKEIITEINGIYFKPVKGQMAAREFTNYLYNSTDLGLEDN